MYIYHYDGILTEIIFRNEYIIKLIDDLNGGLIKAGAHTQYGKNGNIYTTAECFDWTFVRSPAGNVGATIFFHRHNCHMSSDGQRISTDKNLFWEYVEMYSLLSIFEKYIKKNNLKGYIDYVKLENPKCIIIT